MQSRKAAAFLSYVRFNDSHDEGRITQLRERLEGEIRVHTGEEFSIFQDRTDIQWGQEWAARLAGAIESVTFFIPVLTPGFFKSEACRKELTAFLERERELGCQELVLPIYYVDTPLFNDSRRRGEDSLASILANRQFTDWRDLRLEPDKHPEIGKRLARMAAQVRDALERYAGVQLFIRYRGLIQKEPSSTLCQAIDGVLRRSPYWELELQRLHSGVEGTAIKPEQLIEKGELPDVGLVLVEGDPGAGKTVLLDNLARVAAQKQLRLPVLVHLHAVSGDLVTAIRKTIADLLAADGDSPETNLILKAVTADTGVLLLDGWDEVTSGQREELSMTIRQLAGSTRVVIASRRHQDLTLLGVDGNTPHLEICELGGEVIENALCSEIAESSAMSSERLERLEILKTHWRHGSLTVRRLARNPQMLRLLMEFYASRPDPRTPVSEAALIQEAITFVRPDRQTSPFSHDLLKPGKPVADALGAWCWKTLSHPERGHGHRNLYLDEDLRTLWRRYGPKETRLEAWLEHLSESTIWLRRLPTPTHLNPPAYQFRHALFLAWFAANSLMARATSPTGEEILGELSSFLDNVERGVADASTAGQVFRLFSALMPNPKRVRVEDVLCQLLTSRQASASQMAFHLVAGERLKPVSMPKASSSKLTGLRRSSADLIALQIRGNPRHERVAMIRSWTEEARSHIREKDEERSIDLIRVLRGLLLTPSGNGYHGQDSSEPLNRWAERDPEVVVRAYVLVRRLRERMFPAAQPDELRELIDGRLGLLDALDTTSAPPSGHWITIEAGTYHYGDDALAARKHGLASNRLKLSDGSLWIAKYPVTTREYSEFDPDRSADAIYDEPSRPKVFLSWFDAFYYARWRACVEKCPGIDLPTEVEWEAVVSMRSEAHDTIPYPWSHSKTCKLSPEQWRDDIHESLRKESAETWKHIGSGQPWEYGPWPLPLDKKGNELPHLDLARSLRVSRCGIWDADGVAQWTRDAATEQLETGGPLSEERSRITRGSGWGPGRDELYLCAYRRAFTPSFSSFLTGCRLVWRPRALESPL